MMEHFQTTKKTDVMPLSDAQMGVYLELATDPGSTKYNIPIRWTMDRPENMSGSQICQAVDEVLKAHPALYGCFQQQENGPVMCRREFPQEGICRLKTADGASASADEIRQAGQRLAETVLSPEHGPQAMAELYLTKDKMYLLFLCSHLVMDGSSGGILLSQLTEHLNGREVPEEQISAFSVKEMEDAAKAETDSAEMERYFDGLLAGAEVDSSPLYDTKPQKNTKIPSVTKQYSMELPEDLLKPQGIRSSVFFIGVMAYTLAKMTGQKESLFYTATHGRIVPELSQTVTMLVRSLPVYAQVDEELTPPEFLQKLQKQYTDTLAHQLVNYGDLVRKYGLNSRVSFVYQGGVTNGSTYTGGKAQMEVLPMAEAFDHISVSVLKEAGGFLLQIQARADAYTEDTMDRFAELYGRFAQCFLQQQKLKEIPLISDRDLAFLNAENQTEDPYDASKTYPDLFRMQAAAHPDSDVLVFKERTYTFREVDDLTDRIAAELLRRGLKKGQVVSILIHRNQFMLITSLGVMKAGGIYQPLDPSYPKERLDFMRNDAASAFLILDRDLEKILTPDAEKSGILFTDELEVLPAADTKLPQVKPEDGFILLYTSGTTGTPKGNLLSHGNLAALLHSDKIVRRLDEASHVSAYASFGFDAHMYDHFPATAAGGCVYVIPDEMRLDLPAVKDYCESVGMTHLFMTTQVCRQFAVEYPDTKGLKCLMCGGETLVPFEPAGTYRIINGYGPSECTVYSTVFEVDRLYEDIPIGKAAPNNKIYVVDPYGRRLPVGVPGELVISGPQVGQGYINNPEKTAAVFVKNSFDPEQKAPFDRCYMTGDVVRFLEDGNLQFIGRRDQQVKIRGFRIELTEVERVIREYPKVKDATVIAADLPGGGKCIHAYVTGDEAIDTEDLKRFIGSSKPAYMIPAGIMQIDAIPLTPNMKVDKRKLPPITGKKVQRTEAQSRPNRLEDKLGDICKSITGNADFDLDTSFAEMGITSITAIRLAVRLLKEFGLHIEADEILDGATIRTVEDRILEMYLSGQGMEAFGKQQAADGRDGGSASAGKEGAAQAMKEKVTTLISSYPLTQVQMGIYLDCQRAGMDTYNIPLLFELPQGTDIEKLKRAIAAAFDAHPSMNCCIHADEEGDVALYPIEKKEPLVEEEEAAAFPPACTGFTFSTEPLYRFRIISFEGRKYFFLEMHHIISDGTSMQILLEDIDRAYQGLEVEKEGYTAFDHALEEQKRRSDQKKEEEKHFYASLFRGVSQDYLPCPDKYAQEKSSETPEGRAPEEEDRTGANGKGQSQKGQLQLSFAEGAEEIRSFCKEKRVTENDLFLGAFALTLSRFTAHEDASFATIYSGRSDPRTERLISMLVRTLPVYVETTGQRTVEEYLSIIGKELAGLKKRTLYSFADAARDFGVKAEIMFIYQGRMMEKASLDGKELKMAGGSEEGLKAVLCVQIRETDSAFSMDLEYDAARYSDGLMASFADAFVTCLGGMLKAKTLHEISITSEKALKQLESFNDTDCPVPYRPGCRILEDSAARYPERVAVVAQNGSLTYAQLDQMANALAEQLLNAGIPGGSIIEVITFRTYDVYVAQNAALKAGCAFLFLSPEYPEERIRYVTEDAGARALITTEAVLAKRPELEALGIPLFYADKVPKDVHAEKPQINVMPEDTAYAIYTSGSTGKPKGVMLSNKNLCNLVVSAEKNPAIYLYTKDSPAGAAVAAFTFDASVAEEFYALSAGMKLVMASEDEIHDPLAFAALCSREGVTSMQNTPSFLLGMLEAEEFRDHVKTMKTIGCGGENYPAHMVELLRQLNPQLHILNYYGPTETTVICSCKELEPGQPITIGKPTANTRIYMIDKEGYLLPAGALGELLIMGDGVGKGYINRPDLNEKVYRPVNGESAYRSGDLAVITHGREIEYHGRIDNQIKLRGLRVELGEIEAAMEAVPGVRKSVVSVYGDENNRYLAGYYTADRRIEAEEITAEISKTLAEYMVPRVMMQLEEMPLTANGKVDKKALPMPAELKEKRVYTAPETPAEKALCDIFTNVLKLENVGATEDFFSLGGTSLTATKVAMLAMKQGIPIVYADIFKYPTARALAKAAFPEEKVRSSNAPGRDSEAVRKVLGSNIFFPGDDPGYRPIGTLLLTGATGFLGIHMLHLFLENSQGQVYCLIRRGDATSPEVRLNGLYVYYFEESLEALFGTRIHCIDADITDRDVILGLKDLPFDTLINCAASVKHFANSDVLEKVNVEGVRNLTDLCLAAGKRLVQISTVSVAGEGSEGRPPKDTKLHENELYIEQTIGNAYISSKFRAERIVLEAAAEGLDAKILRAGNLMPRRSDGEFQINFTTNGFMRRLKGYYALGCVPYSALSQEFEFSPIDETAGAMFTLSMSDRKYSVFHANNTHNVFLSDVIRVMNELDLKVETVSEEEFTTRLGKALEDTEHNQAVGGLIAYLSREQEGEHYMLCSDNAFTRDVLNRMGYSWHLTEGEYLRMALTQLKEFGFFELGSGLS